MLTPATNLAPITESLTLIGAAGTVLGGAVGAALGAKAWRSAFEYLALGAAAGGVGGCVAAFLLYGCVAAIGPIGCVQ